MNNDTELIGVFLGILITLLFTLGESDSANRFEYQYGEFVCSKNDGFQYFEKRGWSYYTFTCKDGAKFKARDHNIRFVTKGWFDDDKIDGDIEKNAIITKP